MTLTAARLDAGAAAIVCSLSLPQFWSVLTQKATGVELASALGIPVPWSTRATVNNLTAATVGLLKGRLPLYVKTNVDGNGRGVAFVRDLESLAMTLRNFKCRCLTSSSSA
ncbi:hypothetical protein T492DRAFT_831658 [Pavlovales sp. CCMP2436]|nr:hypothetical protein T492DRAFT_831658 [Pavlovales sp. CCMP2436]